MDSAIGNIQYLSLPACAQMVGKLYILVGYFGEMLFLPITNFYDYVCFLSTL